jgi:hypothetical protein
VTLWIDILEGADGEEGEGAIPSPDFTSGSMKGSRVGPSAAASDEFTGLMSGWLDG